MKKLNLKLGGIKEMLSREQMKKVVGGYGYDDGGGSFGCKSSSCSVTYWDGIQYRTDPGNCGVVTIRPPGLFTDPSFVCQCSSQPSGTSPTSNGGVSRCNS